MNTSELSEVRTFHKNKKPSEIYFTQNGKKQGVYKSYHDNGQIYCEVLYIDGEMHGECAMFTSHGDIMSRTNYTGGESHGEHWAYCDFQGTLKIHCFFRDGDKHGEYKEYNPNNGKIVEHCFYNDGDDFPLSDYIEDINNITDAEFMNLSMVFGDNYWTGKPKDTNK